MDRLEKELTPEAHVVRLDVFSSIGRAAAGRYGIRALPTFLLFDGHGQPIYRQSGSIDGDRVKTLVYELKGRM